MENGKWKMENGKWKMENGKWKMENLGDSGFQKRFAFNLAPRKGGNDR